MLGHVEKGVTHAKRGEHLVGRFFDQTRTRVVVLVDAVSEAHQANTVFFVLHTLDVPLNGLARTLNLTEHREHGFVGATVQWAEQRVDASRNRREHVRVGRTHNTNRRRGCVLLVIFVKNQQSLERTHHDRVHLEALGAVAERQPHKVLDVGERVVGVEERLTDALLVRIGSHNRQLGQQAEGGDFNVLRVLRVERVFVVGRQCRDASRQNGHRVSVARKPREEVLEVFVKKRVVLDVLLEFFEL